MTFIDTIIGAGVLFGFGLIIICKLTNKTPRELFGKMKDAGNKIKEESEDKGNVIGGMRYG